MSKAQIIPLSNACLPEGTIDEDIILLLKSLLEKAKRGEIIGLCAAWVEGQHDVVYQIEAGHARDALLVAGVSGLAWDIQRRWRDK